jgi:hypothetical protein
MTVAENFIDYAEKSIQGGIRWALGNVGRRFWGVLAVTANAVAQGATQVITNRLPGHPECAPDARDQIGQDRDLFRYRGESDAIWTDRIRAAWDPYQQGGTPQVVLSEVENWGAAAFGGLWPSGQSMSEDGWSSFTVNMPFGSVPWTTGEVYGGGHLYGDGSVYGIGNADPQDVDHLRRLIRKWKPARSRGFVQVPLVTVSYYDDGVTNYDDGSFYAGPLDILRFAVD